MTLTVTTFHTVIENVLEVGALVTLLRDSSVTQLVCAASGMSGPTGLHAQHAQTLVLTLILTDIEHVTAVVVPE